MQQQQPRHEKTLPEQYKPYLVQFMSFRDGRNYQKDEIFSNEELYGESLNCGIFLFYVEKCVKKMVEYSTLYAHNCGINTIKYLYF